jgi:hypothetical protein
MFHPYTIGLDGGKYTVINDNGQLTFRRHSAAWPAADSLKHSGVVLAMAQRIEELEVAIGIVLRGTLDERGVRRADGMEPYAIAGGPGSPVCGWQAILIRALEQK